MKALSFYFRGKRYLVDEKGRINANNINHFSDTWLFVGGTKHHWSNHVTVPLSLAFEQPELLNGCLGFDRDHGTLREWGGCFNGKLPRITGTTIINL